MGFVTVWERAATQAAIASGSCTHDFHCIAAGLEACGLGAEVLYLSGWRDVRRYSAILQRWIEAGLLYGPDIAFVVVRGPL